MIRIISAQQWSRQCLIHAFLVLLIAACTPTQTVVPGPPSTPQDTGPADGTGSDTAVGTDTPRVIACTSATDCVGKIALVPCMQVTCNTGICTAIAAADAIPCDDGDSCHTDKTCLAGTCQGGMVVGCDDANPCTAGTCDLIQGCLQIPKSGPCDDGNPCTLADHCVDGKCVAGNSVCSCTGPADCVQWDDDNPCNGTLTCIAGQCAVDTASLIACATSSAGGCQLQGCDPVTGACGIISATNGAVCTDGNICTSGDTCSLGQCHSGKAACPCSTDQDCLIYDDGNLCNGVRRCISNQCISDPSTIVNCGGGTNPCAAGGCDPSTGLCKTDPAPDGASCDDLNACTVGDVCTNGMCVGQLKICSDNNMCTNDSCDGNTGQCLNTPNSLGCDDGDPCTTIDVCMNGLCTGTGDMCSCQQTSDCIQFGDGNPCTGNLICVNTKCVTDASSLVYCDSSQNTDCLANQCQPSTGTCQIVPINEGAPCFDGDPCTQDEICFGGTCKATSSTCACSPGQAIQCDDSIKWASDAFGSTQSIDAWTCSSGNYSGKEYAWSFTVSMPQKVTVSLSKEEASTDVFALKNNGSGCTPSACIGAGTGGVTFAAQPANTYYIVVDGKNGTAGKFTIDVTCSNSIESNCENGIDDDNDNMVDCADPDCAFDLACAGTEICTDGFDNDNNGLTDCQDPNCVGNAACLEVCYSGASAYCGLSQYWETGGYKSENDMQSYSCGAVGLDGPEFTYVFNATQTQYVNVTLPKAFANHRILILQDNKGLCSANNCITSGVNQVNFFATAGITYYFVIDGAFGSKGEYQIKVACGM